MDFANSTHNTKETNTYTGYTLRKVPDPRNHATASDKDCFSSCYIAMRVALCMETTLLPDVLYTCILILLYSFVLIRHICAATLFKYRGMPPFPHNSVVTSSAYVFHEVLLWCLMMPTSVLYTLCQIRTSQVMLQLWDSWIRTNFKLHASYWYYSSESIASPVNRIRALLRVHIAQWDIPNPSAP